MIKTVFRKVFGSANERILRSMSAQIKQINDMEEHVSGLSDADLKAKTAVFKARVKSGELLDDLLVEAFAVVREASKRVSGKRHYDVQLIGGIVLHRGMIAEMKTGEGKTLMSTLPIYLNALSGKGVHVITVNDYLAKRDAAWMGAIYEFLGLSVGCIENQMSDQEKIEAYNCDITYGTNNEFGFDCLRDNLKYDVSAMVQRPYNYAIVDEVDSILIDEARTPLIISGPTVSNAPLYAAINDVISCVTDDDCDIDEEARSAILTDKGNDKIESILWKSGLIADGSALHDIENMSVLHYVQQALKAHKLFKADVDYIVRDGKVMIIDEFTGRIMEGRRYSEGLHQAIEAKEKVAIQSENQTLASITFQNYFRMYPKLAGMTGTAMTEAQEFSDIYGLEVVSVPTHKPVKRQDIDDEIYLSAKEKYDAILNEIKKVNATGQPILVGTTSIEKSEYISKILKQAGIKHSVLNARYHEQEAHIIAQAGRFGSVTIATNMAGRGTDIMLGGNPEMLVAERILQEKKVDADKLLLEVDAEVAANREKVMHAGGLYVIGTERHESRRIDNQLRGRSGRQGDPGKTKFYLSMEDDLMRLFGSDKIRVLLAKLGIKSGEAIVHPWISKSIEKAQQKVEGRNYDVRKTLLRFDDVMNDQRSVVYAQRKYIMNTTEMIDFCRQQLHEIVEYVVSQHMPKGSLPAEWNMEAVLKDMGSILNLSLEEKDFMSEQDTSFENIVYKIFQTCIAVMNAKVERFGSTNFENAIRHICIITLDSLWREHLGMLENLRAGIGLRAYGQKDPLNEYKAEAFNMFKSMMHEFTLLFIERVMHLEMRNDVKDPTAGIVENSDGLIESRQDRGLAAWNDDFKESRPKVRPLERVVPSDERDPSDESTWGRVGRNDDCPCKSGKKYKYCHGAFVKNVI